MYFWICPNCGISVYEDKIYEDKLKCNCGYVTTEEEVERGKVTLEDLEKLREEVREEERRRSQEEYQQALEKKREEKRRELQRKKEEELKELEEYEKLKAQKIQKLKDKKQYPSEGKSPELYKQLPSKKPLNIQDEKINESNIQRKDKISGKTLTFVFIVFAAGLGFKLFGTSSRIANMLIGAISGGLGAVIGYAVVKGVNTLTVSKKQKTIIAWFTGIIGLVTFSLTLSLLSSPNNFDACVAENMKNTSSEVAARAIYNACYNLFSAMTYDDYIKAGWVDIIEDASKQSTAKSGGLPSTQQPIQQEQNPNETDYDRMIKNGWIDVTDATPVKTKKYNECVLNNMKGVSTDMAARTLITQCSKKYPTKYLKLRKLTPEEEGKYFPKQADKDK